MERSEMRVTGALRWLCALGLLPSVWLVGWAATLPTVDFNEARGRAVSFAHVLDGNGVEGTFFWDKLTIPEEEARSSRRKQPFPCLVPVLSPELLTGWR